MKFYERLNQAIEEKNYTLKQVAEAMGCSHQNVIYWRNGKNKPNVENAIKLSKLLGFSLDDLDCGTFKPISKSASELRRIRKKQKLLNELSKLEDVEPMTKEQVESET